MELHSTPVLPCANFATGTPVIENENHYQELLRMRIIITENPPPLIRP